MRRIDRGNSLNEHLEKMIFFHVQYMHGMALISRFLSHIYSACPFLLRRDHVPGKTTRVFHKPERNRLLRDKLKSQKS